jgi:hypothetical protein
MTDGAALFDDLARQPRALNGREGRCSPRRDNPDFFVTPSWVTEALLAREVFPGPVWEPACGNGAMSDVLEAAGLPVYSTDLHDHGYGQGGVDFLTQPRLRGAESIVTNPPFRLALEFAEHALRLGARKVALFGRLGFLEGAARHDRLFSTSPPSRIWIFSRRVVLRSGIDPVNGPKVEQMAFAWFVWEQHHPPGGMGWIR